MSVHLNKREIIIKNGRNRKPRPKTFKTKEAAEAWAKKAGVTKFSVRNLRLSEGKIGKYQIVEA